MGKKWKRLLIAKRVAASNSPTNSGAEQVAKAVVEEVTVIKAATVAPTKKVATIGKTKRSKTITKSKRKASTV